MTVFAVGSAVFVSFTMNMTPLQNTFLALATVAVIGIGYAIELLFDVKNTIDDLEVVEEEEA